MDAFSSCKGVSLLFAPALMKKSTLLSGLEEDDLECQPCSKERCDIHRYLLSTYNIYSLNPHNAHRSIIMIPFNTFRKQRLREVQ